MMHGMFPLAPRDSKCTSGNGCELFASIHMIIDSWTPYSERTSELLEGVCVYAFEEVRAIFDPKTELVWARHAHLPTLSYLCFGTGAWWRSRRK